MANRMFIINAFITEVPDDFSGSIGDFLIYLGNKVNNDFYADSNETVETNHAYYNNGIGFMPADPSKTQATYGEWANDIVTNEHISAIGSMLTLYYDGTTLYDDDPDAIPVSDENESEVIEEPCACCTTSVEDESNVIDSPELHINDICGEPEETCDCCDCEETCDEECDCGNGPVEEKEVIVEGSEE